MSGVRSSSDPGPFATGYTPAPDLPTVDPYHEAMCTDMHDQAANSHAKQRKALEAAQTPAGSAYDEPFVR